MAKYHSTDRNEPIVWLFLPYDCFHVNDFYYATLDYIGFSKVRFITFQESLL